MAILEGPAEQEHEQRDEEQLQLLRERGAVRVAVLRVLLGPVVADPAEGLRVVGDDAVDAPADAPPHQRRPVDGPDEDEPVGGARVLQEAVAQRAHEHLLEDVERDARHGLEDASRRVHVEADQRRLEVREQLRAEREVVGLEEDVACVRDTPGPGTVQISKSAGTRLRLHQNVRYMYVVFNSPPSILVRSVRAKVVAQEAPS